MKLRDRLKDIVDTFSPKTRQIVISGRSDLSVINNDYIARWINEFDNTLKCSDGSKLPIDAVSAIVTGSSLYKNEILTRQIVAAIKSGYTPFVLSTNGKQGKVYEVLRTIYDETAIEYVSEEYATGTYTPFSNVDVDRISEFFYQLVCDFQTEQTNGLLVRNYVNVCVAVFFANGNAVSSLITGQLNHLRLLEEIERLYYGGTISDNTRQQFINTANSAQSVSVSVLSVIQDYMYKLRKIINLKPMIQIRNARTPQIKIWGINGNTQVQLQQRNRTVSINRGVNLSGLYTGKCFYLQLKNDVPRNFRDSLNEQCFQWYMARTLKMEIDSRLELRNKRILLIIDDLSDILINWFWWIVDLPNSILLVTYDDFYTKLSATPEHRQQLIGLAETIYFFSVINEESAGWASRTFGVHMVPKVVVTKQPYREWSDIFFPPKSYAHDEVEKPWFSTHEIQHLDNIGIVYSRRHKIFKPYYRENGRTYIDQKYRRQRVNFCLFEFR